MFYLPSSVSILRLQKIISTLERTVLSILKFQMIVPFSSDEVTEIYVVKFHDLQGL